MPSNYRTVLSLLFACFFLLACKKSPKVIESKTKAVKTIGKSESFFEWPGAKSENQAPANFRESVHKVIIKESLPATRYVYLRVQEGQEEFWIATRKAEFIVGDPYYYRGGLLKKQFHSKEYDRTFDKIYLVTQLVPERHGGNELQKPEAVQVETHSEFTSKGTLPQSGATNLEKKTGSMSIAELTRNPQKYEGQTIQIRGKCVKVNPKIMGRNWLHIKDGSADDFDLVVTTMSQIEENQMLTLKAKVVLNKDFGAGYKYDLILENGRLVPDA